MLDKFFCKVNDKQIEFPSEKEAIEYCKENDINPHGIILMGDKYIIKTKDSNFRTTIDKAIKLCDEGRAYSVSYKRGDGPYQAIGVIANSESEAISKAKNHLEKRGSVIIIGASIGESIETMERKGKPIIR